MSGYMLRRDQNFYDLVARPCEGCGHRIGDHVELPWASWSVVNGEVVETLNPDYEPLMFHCSASDCTCRLNLAVAP